MIKRKHPDNGSIRVFLVCEYFVDVCKEIVSRYDGKQIPLDGVRVILRNPEKIVYTDGHGYYAFTHLNPGQYKIEICDQSDKLIASKEILVKAGEVRSLNFNIAGK